MGKRDYDPDEELKKLEIELVRWQLWIKHKGLRVLVIFEGRDAAGKGGVIKRLTAPLNQRGLRVVALAKPTETEKTQWYWQRYLKHLPSAGEIVIFDRSWYNRAGVEKVMGWATDEQVSEFFQTTPELERMLLRSGILLVKYWFSVSDAEQEKRFRARIDDESKRWKLSPMDPFARSRWCDYARAKDAMFAATSTAESPWWTVPSDDKKAAQLNCISHLLSLIEYEVVPQEEPLELPPRQAADGYERPPIDSQHVVPQKFKPKEMKEGEGEGEGE